MSIRSAVRPAIRSAIRSPLTRAEGGGFSLDAYLSSLSKSFRFNTRKTDRYFQESPGPTLADDVGETIGLALDQASWGGNTLAELLAAQTELVTNGTFDTDLSGWTFPYITGTGTAVWSAGALEVTRVDGSNIGSANTTIATVAGRTYQVSYDGSGSGWRQFLVGSSAGNSALLSVSSNEAQVKRTFVAVGTTSYIWVRASTNGTAIFDNISIKEIPGNHAIQTGASTLRPVRQADGAKFDASDDNWLMAYLAAAGSNFIFARTTVPASLSAAQVIAGAAGASAFRVFLAINTSGYACGGVGSDTVTTIVGSTDLRGTEADLAVTFDGSTVRLIVNGVVEYEAAQNSTPTTSIPFCIGALNNNGTGGSFYGGAIKDICAGTDFLTVAKFKKIRAAVAANQ